MMKNCQQPRPPANIRDWTFAGVIGETIEITFIPDGTAALAATTERPADSVYDAFGRRWISSGAPKIAAGCPNPNPFAKTK